MLLTECLYEIILGRKDRRSGHKNHHDLTGGKTAFYQNMAEQAVSRILIVCTDLKGFQHPADRSDDLVRFLILDHTGFHRNDSVALHFVDTGNNISSSVPVKNRMYLIPVVIRLFHAFDRMDGADPFKKFFYCFLFFLKLFFVRHALILAASAFLRYRTEIFGSVLHKYNSFVL